MKTPGYETAGKLTSTSTQKPSRLDTLVVGGRGMLAQDLLARLEQTGLGARGLDVPEIDITKPDELLICIRNHSPRLVINCAAYTAVDKAESQPELAFSVNRDGAANLAGVCKSLGLPLIHISTDYVFDGAKKEPYTENDRANPLSVYGRSKWEGEEAVRFCLPQHLIVRTAWLYGKNGQNFVKTILKLAKEREELGVVNDQHGCPTWTKDLADALTIMAGRILGGREAVAWGTYHYCGSGPTTWYGFACAIVEEMKMRGEPRSANIRPITTKDYPTPAHRPANSVLDCTKISLNFSIQTRPWQTSLRAMISELLG